MLKNDVAHNKTDKNNDKNLFLAVINFTLFSEFPSIF